MDRTAGRESDNHSISLGSIRRCGTFLIGMLCTACIIFCASEASAQCTARDALKNHLTLRMASLANAPPIPVQSAFSVPVWRTITVGTFKTSFALIGALDAAGCGIGDSAGEI